MLVSVFVILVQVIVPLCWHIIKLMFGIDRLYLKKRK